MIITADTHLHIFSAFAKNDNKSSRLEETLKVMDSIYDYAMEHKVKTIVINGDIYETKNVVEALTNNSFVDWVSKVDEAGIKLFLNVGNHDIASLGDESITLLYPFSKFKNVEVIFNSTTYDSSWFNGYFSCSFVPYRRDMTKCREDISELRTALEGEKLANNPLNFLFYHGSIFGAKITNREFLDETKSLTLEDLHPDFFDQVFLGHFHKHQELAKNVRYTGSPLHHSLNDAGDTRGFYHYNPKKDTLEFIRTTYKSFNKVEISCIEDLEALTDLDDDNYHTIKVITDNIDKDRLQFKNTNIKVVWDIKKARLNKYDEDISIISIDKVELLEKYINLNNGDKLKVKKLISLGIEYLEGDNVKS